MKFRERIQAKHVYKRVFGSYMDTKTLIMIDIYKLSKKSELFEMRSRILKLNKPKIFNAYPVYAHEIIGYADTCEDVFEILLKVCRTVYK